MTYQSGKVEGAARKKTPNEIALQIFLIALTVIFVLVVICHRQGVAGRGILPAEEADDPEDCHGNGGQIHQKP